MPYYPPLSVAVPGGGSEILVADAPPVAADNALWWESDTGNLYLRYNDGTSSQWVPVTVGVGTGASGIESLFITPQQFGAKADGGTDDTLALQAALDYCAANLRSLYLPAGNYVFAGTLLVKRGMRFWGEGGNQTFLTYTGAGTALLVEPGSAYVDDNAIYSFSDFTVNPALVNGGSYGVQLHTPAAEALSNWMFERVWIGQFGTRGFFLNNTGSAAFCGTIHRCFIWNGFLANGAGDSISIRATQIHAQGNYVGIELSQIAGARQFTIEDCNITCQGGGLLLKNTTGVNLFNTWVEHPAYYGNHLGGKPGLVTLEGAVHTHIKDCTLNPSAATIAAANYALSIDATSHDNVIGENEWNTGQLAHIGIAAAANGNKIASGQRDVNGAAMNISNLSGTTENAQTQWHDYTVTISGTTGAVTTYGAAGRYRLEGKTVYLELEVFITTNGLGGGALVVNLPFAAKGNICLSGIRSAPTIFGVAGRASPGQNQLLIYKSTDGSYPGADNAGIAITGSYQRV
jgi:hypothetical protein